jgi:hypothetical protein
VNQRRPNFNKAVRAVIEHISQSMPEFSHVQASRILVVAGEARRASRGTVKPLVLGGAPPKKARLPVVKIRGRRMLYCITLRPLFFRASTPTARLGTLVHELYHISSRFDGTLHKDRRHAKLGKAFAKELRPLLRRYLALCPEELRAPFAYDGEVRLWQWLERPSLLPGRPTVRRIYTEEQLFYGAVRMITRKVSPKVPRLKPRLKVH